MKKGFTLIELLAVIVILAILALIVTPIISGVITNAKMSASARSLEGYAESVELAEIRYQTANQGNVTKVLSELSVEAKSKNKVEVTSIVIEDSGIVSSIEANVDGYTCTYNKDSGAICNNISVSSPVLLDNITITKTSSSITIDIPKPSIIGKAEKYVYNIADGEQYIGTDSMHKFTNLRSGKVYTISIYVVNDSNIKSNIIVKLVTTDSASIIVPVP